MVFKDSVRTAQ